MLVAILVVLTLAGWVGFVAVYFWEDIFAWYDNRWGPPSRTEKPRTRRRLYD